MDFKRINSGLLVRELNVGMVDLQVVTERQSTEAEMRDALFCWKVAKFVKSNAIGAEKISRVYSAKIAGIKAADEGLDVKGSAMALDAFFPFHDGIAAANKHGIAMIFIDMRHFHH